MRKILIFLLLSTLIIIVSSCSSNYETGDIVVEDGVKYQFIDPKVENGYMEFVENNPDAVEAFLSHYEESVNYVNENTDAAAELVGNYDIVPAQVAKKALPECNIVYIAGSEMKDKLSGYLSVLMEQNPKAIGGQLPEDDFYYGQ